MAGAGWTCPHCGRWFGKRQAHVCAPPTTAAAWLKDRPRELRAIYAAIAKHMRTLGPVHIEAVSVGFLIKRRSTIAELRPRRTGFALSFVLHRELNDGRVTRKLPMSQGRVYHWVWLKTGADVDAQVRAWLTESYALAEAPAAPRRTPRRG
jgi:hypothetical protein